MCVFLIFITDLACRSKILHCWQNICHADHEITTIFNDPVAINIVFRKEVLKFEIYMSITMEVPVQIPKVTFTLKWYWSEERKHFILYWPCLEILMEYGKVCGCFESLAREKHTFGEPIHHERTVLNRFSWGYLRQLLECKI